jgi:hypothetical protein
MFKSDNIENRYLLLFNIITGNQVLISSVIPGISNFFLFKGTLNNFKNVRGTLK